MSETELRNRKFKEYTIINIIILVIYFIFVFMIGYYFGGEYTTKIIFGITIGLLITIITNNQTDLYMCNYNIDSYRLKMKNIR